jgi:hypothetical protein
MKEILKSKMLWTNSHLYPSYHEEYITLSVQIRRKIERIRLHAFDIMQKFSIQDGEEI